MTKKPNLEKLLNLNFMKLTNRTYYCGDFDFPYVMCPNLPAPDFLALYSETGKYCKTNKTAVCFYQYDNVFDNNNGLYEAIYHNNEKLLAKFKERLKNVKYAISPDYSEAGDAPRIENLYRLYKSRIVLLWMWLCCDIIVIPNIAYANEDYFDVMLEGLEDCEMVAFSIKGILKNREELKLVKSAIRITADKLKNLKKIIVYSVIPNDGKTLKLFEYASSKGIEVVIPDNTLKQRNKLIKGGALNGQI